MMNIPNPLRLTVACAALVFFSACDEETADDTGNASAGETGTPQPSDPSGGAGEDTAEDGTGGVPGDSSDPTADPGETTADGCEGGEGEDPCPGYTECAQTMCASEYEQCMGPNYLDGDFSGGACEAFMTCSNACGCGDTACQQECSEMHFQGDCLSCMTGTIAGCVATQCLDEICA